MARGSQRQRKKEPKRSSFFSSFNNGGDYFDEHAHPDHRLMKMGLLTTPEIEMENTPFISDTNDDREFPSLSSGPAQAQQQNTAWGLRNVSQNAPVPQTSAPRVLKPNQPQAASSQIPELSTQSSQAQQQQSRSTLQDVQATPFPVARSGLEEHRFEEQGSVNESARSSEQTRGIDDFPPLGGLSGMDVQQGRRLGQGQGPQLSGLGSSVANAGVLGNVQRNGTTIEHTSIGGSSPSATSTDKVRSPITNASQGTLLV